MKNINAIESPDINKDGIIDNKDVNLLKDTLGGMSFDDKVVFIHDLNYIFNVNENKELINKLKGVLEEEFGIDTISNKNNDLYLLYQSLFLEGDIIEKIQNKNYDYDKLAKENKNYLLEYSVDKEEYNIILDIIGLDNCDYFINEGFSLLNLIINFKNYNGKVDGNTIYYLGDINIEELNLDNVDTLKKIKLFTDDSQFVTEFNIKLILNSNINVEELGDLLDLGNVDSYSYMGLKDMGETTKSINIIKQNNKEEFQILENKGIKLDNIVELINQDFPIKEYGDKINEYNVYLITILYNRKEIGYNSIKSIDDIINVSNNVSWGNWKENIGIEYIGIEYIENNYEDIGNVPLYIIEGFLNVFSDLKLNNFLDLFYIDYKSYLGKEKVLSYKEILDFYININEKESSLSIVDIMDIVHNQKDILEYKKNLEIKETDPNGNEVHNDSKIGTLLSKSGISIDLFNQTIANIIGGKTLERVKGGDIKTNGDIEYIEDILKIDGLKDFLLYLTDKIPKIRILGEDINILFNIQFIKDILEYKNINNNLNGEKDFGKIIDSYSQNINEFLEIPKNKDTVLVTFQGNKFMGGDNGGAFNGEKGIFKEIFKDSEQIDLSITSKEKKQTPDEIISNLEFILKNKPNKEVIFYIGVHGGTDGTASYGGGDIDKDFFEQINKLANKYPNFKAKIDSCYSGTKINDSAINGNIYSTSENQSATDDITRVLEENKGNLDYNKDGKVSLKEIAFTEMLNYKDSLLGFNSFHSFVKSKNGNITKIPNGNILMKKI